MNNVEFLEKANRLMSQERYVEALPLYKNLIREDSRLKNLLSVNIAICESRLNNNSGNEVEKTKSYPSFYIKTPKLSILVPTYNVELYIAECLNSIVTQNNINDIEIICINDGSTDKSIDIAYQYQKIYPSIKIINQPNSGYGAAINTGLKYAMGEYIGIVEPDDYISSNMYQELLKVAYSNKDADVIRATAIAFTKEGPLDGFYGQPPKTCNNHKFNIKQNPELLTAPPAIWASIYKREFLTKNQIVLPESLGASYQDVAFFLQTAILAENIKTIWHPFYFYRQDNLTASRFSKGKVDVIFDMYDWLSDRLELFDVAWQKQILNRMMNDFKWSYGRIDDAYKGRYLNNVARSFRKMNDLNIDIANIDPKFQVFRQEVIQKSNYNKFGVRGFTVQKNQPIVSLIVPVFNASAYIYEFLNSIISQDYREYELILVNDCSTDNTLEILNKYDYKNLAHKIISLPNNKGASHARNIGIENASGIYLRFVDCDDIIPVNSLAKFKAAIKKYRSDMLKGLLYGYDYKTSKTFQNHWGGRNYEHHLMENILPENAVDAWNLYDHQAFMIRKDIIDAHNIRYPVLKNYQDPPFIAHCLAVAKTITIIPEENYYLVCNRGIKTITRSGWDIENFRALLNGTKQALSTLSESGLYSVVKYKISTFVAEWFDKLTTIGAWTDATLRDEIFDSVRSLQTDYSVSIVNKKHEVKHQIFAFMISNQRYDDAQEYLKKVKDNVHSDKNYLYYYPFWDERNPYLNKVYESAKTQCGRGAIIDAIIRCINVKDKKTVFHLHWTDLYIQRANLPDESSACRTAYYYVRLFEFLKLLGCKFVWTLHNFQPHECNYKTAERILMDGVLSNADHIVVHNQQGHQYLANNYTFDTSKIVIARHGHYIGCYADNLTVTQARESLGVKKTNVHFVFVGQVRPYKGVEDLIEAFNRLSAQYDNVLLTIAGSFPDKDYKQQIYKMVDNCPKNLIQIKEGFIKDDELQRYVKSADFMVFPYKKILTSGSILLSLSFGCPAIAPKSDVTEELIKDGVSGFLFENNLYDSLLQAYQMSADELEGMRKVAYNQAILNDWSPMQDFIKQTLN